MRKIWALPVALGIFLLDQATKAMVVRSMSLGEVRPQTSWFSLVHWQNTGGLFGMLNDLSPVWRTLIFLALPVAGVALLAYLFLKSRSAVEAVILAGVLGGAAGNLLDRVRIGAVTDFLYFHVPDGPGWPAFNVADSVLSTGIILYLLLSLRKPPREDIGAPDPVHHR
jgi:signal peptidase II